LIVIEVETLVERDAVKEGLHVGKRVDRHSDPPDFAEGERVIAVITDLSRQIEGHREPGRPLLEQIFVAAVRLCGSGEPCILAHRPEASAVHCSGRFHACKDRLPGVPVGSRSIGASAAVKWLFITMPDRFS
jgi:hypothetical protein